jgi:hypothetical protein
MRLAGLLGIGLLVLCLTSCGSMGLGGLGDNVNEDNVAGNWQFTMQSAISGTTSAGGILQQTSAGGAKVFGALALNYPCGSVGILDTGIVHSTIKGTLSSGVAPNQSQAQITLTSHNGGSQMTGNFVGVSGCFGGDLGTITADKIAALNGKFSGSLNSTSGTKVPIAVTLTHDTTTGVLGGTATLTGSPCMSSVNLAGAIAGTSVAVVGHSPDNTQEIDISGTTDVQGKNLTMQYWVVTGSCSGDSGSGTATKQ